MARRGLIVAAVLAALVSRAGAETYTWTSTYYGGTSWSDPVNWVGGVPADSDQTQLVFAHAERMPTLDVEGTSLNSMYFDRHATDGMGGMFLITGTRSFGGQQVPYSLHLRRGAGMPAPSIRTDLYYGLIGIQGIIYLQAPTASIDVQFYSTAKLKIEGFLANEGGNDVLVKKTGSGDLIVTNAPGGYYAVDPLATVPHWTIDEGEVTFDSPPAYFWRTLDGVPQWTLGQAVRATGDIVIGYDGVLKIGPKTGNFNILGGTGTITVRWGGVLDFNGQFCPEFGPGLRTLVLEDWSYVNTGGATAVFHPGAVLPLNGTFRTGTSLGGNETLVLYGGAMIRGAGQLRGGRGRLAGAGQVTFDVPGGTATVEHQLFNGGSDTASVVKTGIGALRATGNSTYGATTTIQEGTWLADGTTSGQGDYLVQPAGRLGGQGTIGLAPGRSVIVNGTLAPGGATVDTPGSLTVSQPAGSVVLGGSAANPAVLDVSLPSANSYDVLALDGSLFLTGQDGQGKTSLSLYVGYPYPLLTDTFFIVRNSGLAATTGTFANSVYPDGRIALGNWRASINYAADFEGQGPFSTTGNDICLYNLYRRPSTSTYLDGDCNKDHWVLFNDYQVLETHFGMTSGGRWEDGDFDGNGAVNFADFQKMEVNFGLYVPEPAGLALLAAGAAALLRRRR